MSGKTVYSLNDVHAQVILPSAFGISVEDKPKNSITETNFANAGYFAFYNIMLIFTVADFPMWVKCIITFGSNLIGVLLVKFIEEKSAKEKLWKFEATFAIENLDNINHLLKEIPHNYIEVGKWVIFNIYCATCEQSESVTEICKLYHGKYFVTETKM